MIDCFSGSIQRAAKKFFCFAKHHLGSAGQKYTQPGKMNLADLCITICPWQHCCGCRRSSSPPTSCTGRGATTTAPSTTSSDCRGTATRCNRLTASPSSKRRQIIAPLGDRLKRFRWTESRHVFAPCIVNPQHEKRLRQI